MSTRRGSTTQYPSRRRPRRSSRRGPAIALVAIVLLAAAGLAAVRFEWPAAAIESAPQALAAVKNAPVGEQVERVTVHDSQGRTIPVSLRAGEIWPKGKLASGEQLRVTATVRRASWVSWLLGGEKTVETTVTTPRTDVRTTLLHLAPGAPVELHFSEPASLLQLKLPGFQQQSMRFAKPRAVLRTGLLATGPNRFGVLTVAAAARTWERLSAPARVSWFPEGDRLEALVKPAPGTTIEPTTPIELTFSQPVKAVLGVTRPALDPPTPGIWSQTSANQLTFRPTGSGFALGRPVVVTLPAPTDILSPGKTQTAASLTWSVPVGSTVRLHQLLAELGYLPLSWQAAGAAVADTAAAQKAAALHAPPGTFSWRYANTPTQLTALWKPGTWTRVTQGAVMAFQADHGLAVDGIPGPTTWHTLIKAALAGQHARLYSYVVVHRTVPQTLDALERWPGDHDRQDQHGRARRADAVRDARRVRAHPRGDDARHQSRREQVRRPGDQVDQLLQRRRGHPRLRPAHLRLSTERRLRRGAERDRREDLALHADRHARLDRSLSYPTSPARPAGPVASVTSSRCSRSGAAADCAVPPFVVTASTYPARCASATTVAFSAPKG